jgi:hypothetical protein
MPLFNVQNSSASCTVPLFAFKCGPVGCNQQLFIAAQADVSGPSFGGTGWGNINGGTIFDCKNPNGNCAKYWTFTTECECPVVTTFEPVTCTVSQVYRFMLVYENFILMQPLEHDHYNHGICGKACGYFWGIDHLQRPWQYINSHCCRRCWHMSYMCYSLFLRLPINSCLPYSTR